MPIDSVSYNSNLIPKENISFYKKFIVQQDEIPNDFKFIEIKSSYSNCSDSGVKKVIVQKQSKKSELYKKSLFTEYLPSVKKIAPSELNQKPSYWSLGIFIFCFILVASARALYAKRLEQILNAFVIPRYVNQMTREGNLFSERITVILNIIYFLSFSAFIYEAIKQFYSIKMFYDKEFILFVKIFIYILLYYMLKNMAIRFTGLIFKTKVETKEYLLNSVIFKQIIGLFLLPITFIIYYFPSDNPGWFFLLSFIILGVIIIYRILRGFIIGISFSKFSVFYLFLYLCIIEILPLVLIIKFISSLYIAI